MRVLFALLLSLLVTESVWAQEKPTADTPEQAADKVLAAVKAKDAKALQALAHNDKPDPWLVADELCFRSEHDAAESFAKAAPRVDVEKLPAYVAAWRKRAPDSVVDLVVPGRYVMVAGDVRFHTAAHDVRPGTGNVEIKLEAIE